MIISALVGGLGNQMFEYATGFALAQRRHTRFRLDLRLYDQTSTEYLIRPYQLDVLNISARRISALDARRIGIYRSTGRASAIKAMLRHVPGFGIPTFTDTFSAIDPMFTAAGSNVYLSGFWQSDKYFADARGALLDEFRFRAPPSPANAAVLSRIAAGPSVCVHVRRGDYTLAQTQTQPCSMEYYRAALASMAQRVPDARYFVFSDDPHWTHDHLPVPASAEFVTHNVGVADSEDLRLMSACDHFIIANSSFSWWGAWLSTSPNKHVIAPARWYALPHPSEVDLVPQSWTRL